MLLLLFFFFPAPVWLMFQGSVIYGGQHSITWIWNIYNPAVCAHQKRALQLFSLVQAGDSFLSFYSHSQLKFNWSNIPVNIIKLLEKLHSEARMRGRSRPCGFSFILCKAHITRGAINPSLFGCSAPGLGSMSMKHTAVNQEGLSCWLCDCLS